MLRQKSLLLLYMAEKTNNEINSEEERPARVSFFQSLWGVIKVFVISALIIIPIRTFVAQPFFVRGESMYPNFHDGEYLVIDELSYKTGLRTPKRGDVIVFRYPRDPSQFYIKRIIGLPGEKVTINSGKIMIFNSDFPGGLQLNEQQYLPATDFTAGDVTANLGKDEFFVMGDNREHSLDSRIFGTLPRNLIVGRAWLRLYPVSRAATFDNPQYGGLIPPSATNVPASLNN